MQYDENDVLELGFIFISRLAFLGGLFFLIATPAYITVVVDHIIVGCKGMWSFWFIALALSNSMHYPTPSLSRVVGSA
jgi:hypothetical protein